MRGESAAAVAAAAAAARPGKRPLRALSAAEKMEAIQRVHEGESKASVARDIGVPESTLRGWCKSEHKIRGMARNSSTPDSEAAHSPASSNSAHPAAASGLGPNAASSSSHPHGNNSEDEAAVCPPKRMRPNEEFAPISQSELIALANGYKAAANGDYLGLLNNLVNAGSLSPTQGALLCQQLGFFQNASTSVAATQKSQQQQQQQQLSFVENGLQYSSGSGKSSQKRASTSSAIAPTSHVDSVSKSGVARKSLPAAAEAPLTSLPLSPRRGNSSEQPQQQQQQIQQYNQQAATSSSSSGSTPSTSKTKIDPALLLWLEHQQQLMCQKAITLSSTSSDWFWQYCKTYGGSALLNAVSNLVRLKTALNASLASSNSGNVSNVEPVAEATAPAAITAPPAVSDESAAATTTHKSKKFKSNHYSLRKSPSKARALVEDAVCNNNNNNNESAKRSLNLDSTDEEAKEADNKEEESNISLDEALKHARIFSKWLDNYRDPTVCVSQIVQFRVMLNNLEKKASPAVVSVRRTRKRTPQSVSKH